MKLYVIYLFYFFSFSGIAQSNVQNDTIPTNQINLLNSEYKDFVTVKNHIYAISENNNLVAIDLKKESFKLIKNNISAIAKKSNNELVFGSKDGKIFTLYHGKKVKQIEKIDAEIFSILINSKDEYIVYSKKSIYYNKKDYIPKKETNFYGKVRAKYTGTQLIEPDYIFLDKKDFIWFAYDEGEWGGNVCFFDLNKKEFIYEHWLMIDNGGFGEEVKYNDRNEYFTKLKETYPDKIKITETDTIYQYPYQMRISSVTKAATYDNQNNLYVASSGNNYMIYQNRKGFNYFVDGTLTKITKRENNFYKSCSNHSFLVNDKYKEAFNKGIRKRDENLNELRNNILTENEINILGPISFNHYNNKLYMYSSKGYQVVKNLNCNFTEELIFKPYLTCKAHGENDYCTHLNVIKFEFISEKEMLFLTKNNGIGYYNGDTVIYLRSTTK
ncbi:hypothetical protein FLJC2902T_32500 [Flavobacterium limnosediminis JC2902]|uniref:Uncharacterized protein n=1 Tax=Flavobacterium limnosediminis JC2902 TaxID=1341181 RepID=V6S7Z0_9FLAO|nr:hypothetical protein [Flavobacterium limnosediminis]ESU22803.1 hypothetical protein FLJC2902T_32500 [Flavobacterium limnosediminis JC2902]